MLCILGRGMKEGGKAVEVFCPLCYRKRQEKVEREKERECVCVEGGGDICPRYSVSERKKGATERNEVYVM